MNYDQAALVFKALGHPVRLGVVEKLAKGEACVCTLQADSGCAPSTFSRHLQVLREAGVIRMERDAQKLICSLALTCAASMLGCLMKDGCSPGETALSCTCGGKDCG